MSPAEKIAVAIYTISAIISSMPPKGTVWTAQTFYGWFYDFSHLMLNARKDALPIPNPTMPVNPAIKEQ